MIPVGIEEMDVRDGGGSKIWMKTKAREREMARRRPRRSFEVDLGLTRLEEEEWIEARSSSCVRASFSMSGCMSR